MKIISILAAVLIAPIVAFIISFSVDSARIRGFCERVKPGEPVGAVRDRGLSEFELSLSPYRVGGDGVGRLFIYSVLSYGRCICFVDTYDTKVKVATFNNCYD